MYNLVKDFPEKIKKAYNLKTPKINRSFKRIAVLGMGANYILGSLLKQLLRDEIPVDTDINLLDNNTLLILSSYSGNTKEVLKVFDKIKNKKNILVLTSGGKLLKKAKKNNVKIIKIPPKIHQRFTFAECFFPLIKTLQTSNIIKNKTININTLIKNKNKLEKEAIKLSIKLKNKIPLFYSSNFFYPAVYRLQTSLEEDAKIICHSNKITELFHNEIEALPDKRFFPVLIIDYNEIKNFKKQISFFKKHIKDYYEIKYNKLKKEERMFLIFYFADFLGYYLSKLKKEKIGKTLISDKIKKL